MKIENGTVLMVLDGTKMLLFRNDGDAKYPVLTTLAHENSANPPSSRQGTDAPGRTHSSMGDGRSSSYGETDWHQQSEDHFARHAAEVLEQAASRLKDEGVVVIAAPRTLGEMRKHYGRETGRRLLGEISKDLAGQMTDRIIEVIVAHSP